MAEYRNILFGYCMVDREITLHPTEKDVVLEMFSKYAQGLSYNNIAEDLTLSQVAYLPDKSKWNKNMVARILQNEQYLGKEKYPALLTQEQWDMAQRQMKCYNYTISPEIKALKPKISCEICGGTVERLVTKSGKERWKCVNDVSHISTNFSDKMLMTEWSKTCHDYHETGVFLPINQEPPQKILDLEQELKEIKVGSEVPHQVFLQKAKELARLKYETCQIPNIGKINECLQVENIVKLTIADRKIQKIQLKNGDILERRG